MPSKTEIVNLAATFLGQPAIENFDTDTTRIGEAARATYDMELDSALRGFTWNFATKRRTSAATGTSPTYGFDHAFDMLADELRVTKVEGGDEFDWVEEDRQILTSIGSTINYSVIIRETDGTKYDAMFVTAFARRLAMNWAETILHSTTAAQEQRRLFAEVLREAKSVDSKSKTPDVIQADGWIRSRGNIELRLATDTRVLPLLANDPNPALGI